MRWRNGCGALMVLWLVSLSLPGGAESLEGEEVRAEAQEIIRAERKRDFRAIDPDQSTSKATPEFDDQPLQAAKPHDITQALPLKTHCEYAANYAESETLTKEDVVKAALCKGYVIGFVQATNTASQFGKRPYCLPDYLTFDKIISIYVKWLDDHPRWKKLTSSQAVMRMLQSLYPCPMR